jgi:predicted O-methyltransferase YrrM
MKTYEDIAQIIQETEGLLEKHIETRFLFEAAANLKPNQNIIEIGSYRGLSSLCLGFGASCNNDVNRLFCFTIWHKEHSLVWHSLMDKHKLKNTVIYGDANIVMQQITVSQVGLIFIDSNHMYEDCKMQFELSCRGASPNCLVAFHDYGHAKYPDVKKYCDELVAANKITNTNKIGSIFYGTIAGDANIGKT